MNYPNQIIINGHTFKKEESHPWVAFYCCEETRQEVKVSWSEFWNEFQVMGSTPKHQIHPYYLPFKDLSRPINFPHARIEYYLTEEEDQRLREVVHKVMVEAENK